MKTKAEKVFEKIAAKSMKGFEGRIGGTNPIPDTRARFTVLDDKGHKILKHKMDKSPQKTIKGLEAAKITYPYKYLAHRTVGTGVGGVLGGLVGSQLDSDHPVVGGTLGASAGAIAGNALTRHYTSPVKYVPGNLSFHKRIATRFEAQTKPVRRVIEVLVRGVSRKF